MSNCHGANRLGANSILDVVVFGKAIGLNMANVANPGASQPKLKEVINYVLHLFTLIDKNSNRKTNNNSMLLINWNHRGNNSFENNVI